MAAFNYAPIRTLASSMVQKFGQPVIFLRTTEGAPSDATKPWRVGAGTVTQYPCKAVVADTNLPVRSDPSGENEKTVIVAGLDISIKPTLRDRLQIRGAQYQILGFDEYNFDGGATAICWKLRCRAWPSLLPQPSTEF